MVNKKQKSLGYHISRYDAIKARELAEKAEFKAFNPTAKQAA